MATTPGTIKHRHQSVLPTGTSDVDVPQWNDSEVVAGGSNGDVLQRDTTQTDGWGWTPLGIYAPLNSPAFTGVPTAPTAAPGTSTTQVATTAFVAAASAPPVWTAVAYSAANFTTNAGTWTVDSGDQTLLAYRLSGKTLTLKFTLINTTVSGSPAELRITLPAGAVVALGSQYGPFNYFDGAVHGLGIISAVISSSVLRLQRDVFATGTWPNATNLASFVGQMDIVIV
jgi:hypothetical protein